MTCYCKKGMLEEAQNVYKRLEEFGCKPNATTFRSLVYYLCLNEMFEAGYRVFKTSVGHNKIPDFNTLKHLAEGLVKKKKMKSAKGLIRTVRKKFPPNVLNAWRKVEENLGLKSVTGDNDEKDENEDDNREAAAQ